MKPLIWPNSRLRIVNSFRCNFKCPYCGIDYYQEDLCKTSMYDGEEKTADEWIDALSRLHVMRLTRLILGTGEPALYPGIERVVNSLENTKDVITLVYTNASTKSLEAIGKMKPRDNLAFYVSFPPLKISAKEFAKNYKWLCEKFRVIDCHTPFAPEVKDILPDRIKELKALGVDLVPYHSCLVSKPGEYNFYDRAGESPKFKDRFASRCFGVPEKTVYCKTSFNHARNCNTMSYPVAPNGNVYTCWRYLFNLSEEGILGNFFDPDFALTDEFFECNHYGDCNMCAWDRNIIDKETGLQLDTDVIARDYL